MGHLTNPHHMRQSSFHTSHPSHNISRNSHHTYTHSPRHMFHPAKYRWYTQYIYSQRPRIPVVRPPKSNRFPTGTCPRHRNPTHRRTCLPYYNNFPTSRHRAHHYAATRNYRLMRKLYDPKDSLCSMFQGHSFRLFNSVSITMSFTNARKVKPPHLLLISTPPRLRVATLSHLSPNTSRVVEVRTALAIICSKRLKNYPASQYLP